MTAREKARMRLVGIVIVMATALVPRPAVGGWERQQSGVNVGLGDVVFMNDHFGCACGMNNVVRTSNGGQSWTTTYTGAGGGWLALTAIDFADTLIGLAVGDSWPGSYSLRTSNGGLSWNQTGSQDIITSWLTDCRLLKQGRGWAIGGVNDMNQMAEWNFVNAWPSGPQAERGFTSFYKIDAVDSCTAWIAALNISDSSHVLRTTDGGDSWLVISRGFDSLYVTLGMDFIDQNEGWIVSRSGRILHTTDGGLSWTCQFSSDPGGLLDVSFADSLNGLVVGAWGLVLRTRDGGVTWERESTGVWNWLRAVSFVDTMQAWAVGDSGVIIHNSPEAGTAERQPSHVRSQTGVLVYPSPTASEARVELTLPVAARVSVVLRDELGRSKLCRVDRSLPAGKHDLRLDLRGLAPGVYFCTVAAGQDRTTARLTITR